MKTTKSVATGPDGAIPTQPMKLSGVVRTTRGYALATATVSPDGKLEVKLGNSQTHVQFVAREAKAASLAGALKP